MVGLSFTAHAQIDETLLFYTDIIFLAQLACFPVFACMDDFLIL